MRLVFDIETNGFLEHVTDMWCLIAHDLKEDRRYTFEVGDEDWMRLMRDAERVIGHHILGYDLLVLQKLFKFKLPKKVHVTDTLIMSKILDYKRFGERPHSLETWGEELGFPKDLFNDFSRASPELTARCQTDVSLNIEVYKCLLHEFNIESRRTPNLKTYLQAEHAAAKWNGQAELNGWPFDITSAKALFSTLDKVLSDTVAELEPKLGTKTVALDKVKGEVEVKTPKWTKEGAYHFHTANYFNVDPWSGYEGEERIVEGPYCRVAFEPLALSSVSDVKIFLDRNGWVPTEWNTKRDPITNKMVKTSPKVTEDSLEFLGGDGKLYTAYTVAKSRHAILKGLIENTDSEDRVHGSAMLIGTPSMRSTHQLIVNMPSADAEWGPEFRKLFITTPGWKIIGADSSGNQARGLAHYLNDATYIDTLLNGDIHQANADILTKLCRVILNNPTFVVTRSQAKRILYAFLFGAAGAKLWSYIFGVLDEKKGKKLKDGFVSAVPGFLKLLEKLKDDYDTSRDRGGYGYIRSIAGVKVYVDSMHKLLVYLLQSCEKATCSSAIMLLMEWLDKEEIPYEPYIYYHDEVEFAVPEMYAERAAELGKLAFKEGPKLYGITIMDGDAKVGDNWYDVH